MTQNGDIIGVITARGGSRGLPGKNVALVGGIPLVCRTVDAMLAAKSLNYSFVSTDDDEIAQLCRERGANVPFKRPAELATDEAAHYRVLQHALQWYEETFNRQVRILCLLQPTAPFTIAEDIDHCVAAALSDPECSAAIAMVEPRYDPFTVYFEQETDYLRPLMGERGYDLQPTGKTSRHLRRQDSPPVLQAAGAVFAAKRATLMELNSPFGLRARPVAYDSERFCDIDSPVDLALAQAQHQYLMETDKITS